MNFVRNVVLCYQRCKLLQSCLRFVTSKALACKCIFKQFLYTVTNWLIKKQIYLTWNYFIVLRDRKKYVTREN